MPVSKGKRESLRGSVHSSPVRHSCPSAKNGAKSRGSSEKPNGKPKAKLPAKLDKSSKTDKSDKAAKSDKVDKSDEKKRQKAAAPKVRSKSVPPPKHRSESEPIAPQMPGSEDFSASIQDLKNTLMNFMHSITAASGVRPYGYPLNTDMVHTDSANVRSVSTNYNAELATDNLPETLHFPTIKIMKRAKLTWTRRRQSDRVLRLLFLLAAPLNFRQKSTG